MGKSLGKTHFVLIHGTCHGAWCWYKVSSILKQRGHRVTALDLGASGINPKRLDEVPMISDYLQPLVDMLMADEQDKVVLVGHSYGGLCISKAMELFPHKVSVAVFLSAYLPRCRVPPSSLILEYFSRTPVESLMDCEFSFDQGMENPPTSALFGPQFMKANPYEHCELKDLELAKMLVRPSRLYVKEWSKDVHLLTEDRFGSVKKAFIVLEDDQTMKQDFQHWMIENSQLNVDVKLIKNCGHMVMLSKPEELCLSLLEIADKYN
ncbi:methylesterase 10 [Rutidosis leptorrhynchoides]|uniref:methylesterase 10 n=1 Tax=Rutidosis leptorrhynchoides TaxID=125765 RepID=UPI003A996CBA